jgi:hypothetical protein
MRQTRATLDKIQEAYDNRMPPEYWVDDLEDTPDSLVEHFVTHENAARAFAVDELGAIRAYVAKLLGSPDPDSWAVEFVAEELSLLYYAQV